MPSSMVGCYTDPESYVGTLYTGRFDVCVTEPGRFEAKYLMSLAMAHAGRLAKYGA